MPTQAHVDAYVHHLQVERHLSAATVRGYRQDLSQLVRRGVAFEPDALGAFVRTGDDGSSLLPNTRNRRLVVLRAFIAWLMARGELAADPTASIERAKVPRVAKAALGVDDVRTVLATLRREVHSWRRTRDEAILVLLFHTGLRVSEVRNLDLAQVDLDAGLLRATHRKGAVRQDVPLNEEARAVLRTWLAARPEGPTPAVFVGGRRHGRLSVRYIQVRLAELGEAAGLGARLHPHALRHAHATALLRAGVATEIIRQSLNHASLQTTQRYLHGDLDLLRAGLAKLPSLEAPEGDPE